jgi:hypothetical protein
LRRRRPPTLGPVRTRPRPQSPTQRPHPKEPCSTTGSSTGLERFQSPALVCISSLGTVGSDENVQDFRTVNCALAPGPVGTFLDRTTLGSSVLDGSVASISCPRQRGNISAQWPRRLLRCCCPRISPSFRRPLRPPVCPSVRHRRSCAEEPCDRYEERADHHGWRERAVSVVCDRH